MMQLTATKNHSPLQPPNPQRGNFFLPPLEGRAVVGSNLLLWGLAGFSPFGGWGAVGFWLALFLVACSGASSETEKSAEKELSSPKALSDSKTEVQVVALKTQAFEYKVALQGKVEARASSQVRSKQAGLIQKLYVSNGQTVGAGQTLAELDRTELALALEKARNQVAARKADYQDRLLRQRIDIQKEEELSPELRQSFRISSGLADAEIALKEAELNLGYTSIKSPIAGTVANLDFKTFQYISPDKPLCTVYSAGQLEVVGEVLESEVGQLKLGQKAIIQTVLGEKSYEAILQEINPLVNEKGLVKVRLRLLTSEGLLLGMNVQAQIIVPRQQTLVVPKDAVVIRSGKKVVFTMDDGLAKWNYVETGLENEQSIEIIKGLQTGQKAIITNNLQLAHDAPVKVVASE